MNVGIELLPFPTGNWLVAGMPRLFGSHITGHSRVALHRDRRKQGALTGLAGAPLTGRTKVDHDGLGEQFFSDGTESSNPPRSSGESDANLG
jgi:hypothetical protein